MRAEANCSCVSLRGTRQARKYIGTRKRTDRQTHPSQIHTQTHVHEYIHQHIDSTHINTNSKASGHGLAHIQYTHTQTHTLFQSPLFSVFLKASMLLTNPPVTLWEPGLGTLPCWGRHISRTRLLIFSFYRCVGCMCVYGSVSGVCVCVCVRCIHGLSACVGAWYVCGCVRGCVRGSA